MIKQFELMTFFLAFLSMGMPYVTADEIVAETNVVPAQPPDQNIKPLLLKIEQQIANGHTTAPASDNAVNLLAEVFMKPDFASPETLKVIANFVAHLRERAEVEEAAGRETVAADFAAFADLATDLMSKEGAAKAPPESPDASQPASIAINASQPAPASTTISTVEPGPSVLPDPANSTSLDAIGALTDLPEQTGEGAGAIAPPSASAVIPVPGAQAQSVAALYAARGDQMLAIRDVSAARRLYAYAANGGSAIAATALARTYDPDFLPQLNVIGLKPDASLAATWYRKALALGDRDAETRLNSLGTAAAK